MSKQNFTSGLKRKAAANAVAMVVSVVGILVAVNVIGSGSYGRVDLSDGDIHSLSQASMDAVSQMEGLEIRVYSSKKLPKALRAPGVDIKNVPRLIQQLQDKLAEFKRASNGNLTISNIREDLESQAGALKLIGMQVPG
ncbi:MAG TPA: hypothetical protein EYN06_03610, partial [Myxococcales bacterium]|nr:hypothetical protein [Myxococcales bacterium]HIN85545.1 hypothetical protein [Myxococcales bacterium]